MEPNKIAPESVYNAPVSNVGDNSPTAHASVQDRAGLYIAIVALILATLAIGLVIAMPQIIDAKVQAAVAQAKGDMQEQVAEAKQVANAGATDGRLALDRVEKTVAKLEAKGLVKESH